MRKLPGTVTVRLADGTSIDTGMPKLGAVLGDRTQIGCNAVTSPGTIVGRDCVIYASVPLHGCMPPGSIVAVAARTQVPAAARRGRVTAAG